MSSAKESGTEGSVQQIGPFRNNRMAALGVSTLFNGISCPPQEYLYSQAARTIDPPITHNIQSMVITKEAARAMQQSAGINALISLAVKSGRSYLSAVLPPHLQEKHHCDANTANIITSVATTGFDAARRAVTNTVRDYGNGHTQAAGLMNKLRHACKGVGPSIVAGFPMSMIFLKAIDKSTKALVSEEEQKKPITSKAAAGITVATTAVVAPCNAAVFSLSTKWRSLYRANPELSFAEGLRKVSKEIGNNPAKYLCNRPALLGSAIGTIPAALAVLTIREGITWTNAVKNNPKESPRAL